MPEISAGDWVDLALNLFVILLWVWFFCLTLGLRVSKPTFMLCFTFLTLLALSSCFLPTASAQRHAMFLGALVILEFTAFKGSFWRKLLYLFCAYAITGIGEYISILLYPDALLIPEHPELRLKGESLLTYLVYLATLAFMFYIASLLFNRHRRELTRTQWISYILLPLSQTLTFNAFYFIYFKGLSGICVFYLVLAVVSLVAGDVMIVRAVNESAEKTRLETENRLLAKQIDAQTSYYAGLTRQYEENRAMRHDIHHHLHTIQILLWGGEERGGLGICSRAHQPSGA